MPNFFIKVAVCRVYTVDSTVTTVLTLEVIEDRLRPTEYELIFKPSVNKWIEAASNLRHRL